MSASASANTTSVEIVPDKRYYLDTVAEMLDYSTGHLRNLDRAGRIPKSSRDEKNWRYWEGVDVIKILNYKEKHAFLPVSKFKNRKS